MVVMAHLQAQATRRIPEERLVWKLRLTKGLYSRGYKREDILDLFRFIDWVMALPSELEQHFDQETATFEEGKRMKYISSLERTAIERGHRKGLEQGLEQGRIQAQRDAIITTLRIRFEQVAENITTIIAAIDDLAQLEALFRESLTVESLAAFEKIISDVNQG